MINALLITALLTFKAYGSSANILIYHKFDEKNSPSTSISMKNFKNQMKYLKTHNYNVVSLGKIVNYLETGTPIPPKTVAITIDDGYRSTMKAFKILKKYNYPFTLFLYAEGIEKHYPAYLKPKELQKIAKYPKVSFGNHSYSHKRFARLIKSMNKEEYKKLIKQDTLKAQEIIKKLTGQNPIFYAFPYGEYNRTYIEALKELNLFSGIFSQDNAAVSNLTPAYLISRKPVVGSWSKMENFKRMIEKEALPVIKHYPPADYIKENLINIYAEIENPENYKNCHIYLSEIGWVKAKKIGNRIESVKPLKISRWKNRISVECYNKKTKKFANYIWMIIH